MPSCLTVISETRDSLGIDNIPCMRNKPTRHLWEAILWFNNNADNDL